MTKKLIFILSIALLFSLIPSFNSYADEVLAPEVLKDLGVLKGDSYGNLMLDKPLKRQDMVVLLSRLYKEENKASNYLMPPDFNDLNATNSYYHSYIKWATDKNLIIGMAGKRFGFGEDVKVQDFQVVLLRVLDYKEESGIYTSVPEIATKLGIMKGLDLDPSSELLRKDMAYMTLNALQLNKKGSPLTLAQILELDLKISSPKEELPKEEIEEETKIETSPKEDVMEIRKEIQNLTL
ncbi:MAG: S-layer homology domain-containing protein [Gudongella sp.]|nr:S-layer homology domain-containing protein [Gudongella sp.]